MHPISSIALVLLLAAPAAAQEKPVLTVYTYDSFTADWGPGPKVEAAFEATCACDLEWVAVEDGVALLTRLKLEGKHTDADVVLGLDTNLVVEAKATGLFAPAEIDQGAIEVPGGFEDDVFVPYDYAHFAVVVDSEALPNPPQSLKELVEGGGEGQIVIQDPRTSTPRPRPPLVDQGGLRRRRARRLGEAERPRADGDAGLERILRPVHQG